jgi:hypothetical protein
MPYTISPERVAELRELATQADAGDDAAYYFIHELLTPKVVLALLNGYENQSTETI